MDISTILYYKKLMKIVLYNRIRYPKSSTAYWFIRIIDVR